MRVSGLRTWAQFTGWQPGSGWGRSGPTAGSSGKQEIKDQLLLTDHRSLEMPFGGCKDSGTGREGTNHSLELFTEEKTHCIKIDVVPNRNNLHLHGWG